MRRSREADGVEANTGPERDFIDLADVVTIRQFRDLHEALLAKATLDSAGVQCFLVDDNMVRMDWFYSNLVGGVKLCVNQKDAEIALDILEQPIPVEFEVEGVERYEQPHCPKCQPLDIASEELNMEVAWVSAYLLVPIVLRRKRWTCHSCGHRWQQLEDEAP